MLVINHHLLADKQIVIKATTKLDYIKVSRARPCPMVKQFIEVNTL